MTSMNGFKALKLENFQSHTNTMVEFAPSGGLLVLVGGSDSGKTSIIRGLRWLLFNVPSGDDFIRVGATFARVTLELESGQTVIRERTKGGVNRYKVLTPNENENEPSVFEGFGHDVPLEIRTVTGVSTVQVGDISLNLNIADQLQGPFLGSSISSGARAKVLGKLAGTEEIDYAGKELGTDLYRRNQDVKRLGSELATLNDRIEEYGWLSEYKQRIDDLTEIVAKVKVAQERRDKLSGLNGKLADIEGNLLDCETVLWRWQCLLDVEYEVGRTVKARERGVKVLLQKGRLETLHREIGVCQHVVDRWQDVESADSIVKAADIAIWRRRYIEHNKQQVLTADLATQEAQQSIARLSGLGEAHDLATTIQGLSERRRSLCSLNKALIGGLERIDEAQKALKRWVGVDEAERVVGQINAAISRRSILFCHGDMMKRFVGNVEQQARHVVLWESRVAELASAYRDELVNIGQCPTCGSVVSPKTLSERLKEAR